MRGDRRRITRRLAKTAERECSFRPQASVWIVEPSVPAWDDGEARPLRMARRLLRAGISERQCQRPGVSGGDVRPTGLVLGLAAG
jgi:hypothetical protein